MRRLATVAGLLLFVVGAASLALTLYLWFGDWPRSVKESVDYFRSAAATEGRPPEPLVTNVAAREALSLDGTWQVLIDPLGLASTPLTAGMVPRNVQPSAPSDLIEFSFDGGPTLEVPGDWNTQDERLFFYEGQVWYRRSFEHERRPGHRYVLHFGAANHRAAVYLNGRRVGDHAGGFTPFDFEVTGLLKDGENQLIVMVDNTLTPLDVPVRHHDWLNYGGLTREVRLLDLPGTFVRDYLLELDPDNPQQIRGWVQLDGDEPVQDVAIVLPELKVEHHLRTDATGRGSFAFATTLEKWSPESPRLYLVEVRAETDSVKDVIGFRTIAVKGRDILLNGEPVFLRGISIHEEKPGPDGGRAWSKAQARELLGWALDLGCNFVRLAHYPHDEHMVRMADELGLMVWAEVPVYWNVAFGEPATLENAKQQLSEMITRDRNRASIVLWSIGNETPVSEERNAFMRALADHVRAEDPTRPITAALLAGPKDVGAWMARDVLPSAVGIPNEWVYQVSDPLGEIVDVAALNEYFGWYYASPLAAVTPLTSHEARQLILENLPNLHIETGLDKPLIVSEFGGGAKYGFRAPEEDYAVFSEDYQALIYRKQLEMLARQPDVRGLSPWILKDFRSPLRTHPRFQQYFNRKGLVSETGERKLAFDVLREDYERRASAEKP